MINVLQVVGGLDRGGIETLFYNIYKNLDRKKFQFIFLCYGNGHFDYEDSLKEMGAKIVRMDYPSLAIWKYCSELKRILKREKIDIVHCNTYFNSGIVNFVAKHAGVKVRITHSHSSIDDKKQTLIRKLYAWICRRMIFMYTTNYAACSKDAAAALFRNRQYKLIFNGVEVKKFKYNEEWRRTIRNKLNVREDAMVIGTVGRQTEVKNPIFLLDVFYEILNKSSDAYLLMVGRGELRDSIQQKVKILDIEDRVIFVEPTDDVYKYYSAMDFFVLPSQMEGLSMALIEAQISGAPAFVSDGIPDEALITRSVKRISLARQAGFWAREILKTPENNDRKNIIIDERYDITNTTKDLERWYKELVYGEKR